MVLVQRGAWKICSPLLGKAPQGGAADASRHSLAFSFRQSTVVAAKLQGQGCVAPKQALALGSLHLSLVGYGWLHSEGRSAFPISRLWL